MSSKISRRSKAKLSCFNSYIERMNDFVSSSQEEYNKTDYQPEIILTQSLSPSSFLQLKCLTPNQQQNHFLDDSQSGNKNMSLPQSQLLKYNNEDFQIKQKQQSSQFQKSCKISDISEQILKKKEESNCESLGRKIEEQSTGELKASVQQRKKNIFLTRQQKQRLEYDIKSQRFLLTELITKYGISRSTIKRYLSEINTYGQILIPEQKTRVVSASKQSKLTNFIKTNIVKNPFLSQKQMALLIKEELGLDVSQQTVSLILKKSNITKKKGMITYKQGNTEQNIERRYQYAQIYQQINEDKVIFMDQTGFNQCFQVQYGYAPRGKRLLKEKSGKKGHKVVVILSMTYSRICHWDIIDLSVKTEHVAAYIKKFPRQFRGYSLIMDNAKVHKTQQISEAVISVGLTPVYLPPYSPQLNPIQLLFGRLKAVYKNMMGVKLQQPTVNLANRVNTCIQTLISSELENYKRPVNFWIQQALKRKKFNEVTLQKN